MERIRTQHAAEVIARAMAVVPPRIRELVPVEHWEGDPQFAGHVTSWSRGDWLERNGDANGEQPAVRAVCLARQSRRRDQQLALLAYLSRTHLRPSIVLHEFGHAVYDYAYYASPDELLPDGVAAWWTSHHHGAAGDWDFHELWAEAFTAWLLSPELMVEPGSRRWRAQTDYRYMWEQGRAAERFYERAGRHDNRGMLACFNRLAGWPVDRRPPATDGCWP